jgi:hypothetical protein
MTGNLAAFQAERARERISSCRPNTRISMPASRSYASRRRCRACRLGSADSSSAALFQRCCNADAGIVGSTKRISNNRTGLIDVSSTMKPTAVTTPPATLMR